MTKLRSFLLAMITAGLTFASLAFFGSKGDAQPQITGLWTVLPADQVQSLRVPIPTLAPLIKRVEPAVLVVTTESVVQQQMLPQNPFGDLFPFFNAPPHMPPQERKSRGQGSGFIIHPSGLALTNHHVVEGATTIKIKVGDDSREYDAEVLGSDESTDFALIQIKGERKDWPVIPLGSSTNVQVGDFAVAIGNPLGLELSASYGMVSARGRRDIHPSGRDGLFDFLQIDAPINPGNSGGPLLNLSGEAIGINTAISAAGQGIAFSIPIDQIKQLLPQLKETGRIARSWIGVAIEDVKPDVAKEMGLSVPHGALVREVVKDSPAAKAGIEPGDIISELDGQIIKDASSLRVKAGLAGVGKSLPIKVIRETKAKSFTITLEALPGDEDTSLKVLPSKENKTDLDDLGIGIVTLNNADRNKLELEKRVSGVRIVEIARQSAAAFAGLKVNDVIVKINGHATPDVESLTKILGGVKKGGILRIFLRRGASSIFVAIPKP